MFTKNDDVRITLDTNIASPKEIHRFLDDTKTRAIGYATWTGVVVGKVWWVPSGFNLPQSSAAESKADSVSKYYICRKYAR